MLSKLQEIISCLNSAQLRVLKDYLNAFARRGDDNTQIRRLLDSVIKYPGRSESFYSNIVYGSVRGQAIGKLISRLYHKAIDSLLIDINLNRLHEQSDKLSAMQIQVKKMLLQHSILKASASGLKVGYSLLVKAEKISEQYEFFTSRIEALTQLKALSPGKSRSSTFHQWDRKLKETEEMRKAYHRAFDWFNKYRDMNNYQANLSPDKHISFLEEAIRELDADYKQYKSPTSAYFLGILETAYYEQKKEFKTAIERCKYVLELLNRYESIKTQMRIAVQYSNISIMELQLGRLADALRYNELSISVSHPDSPDMIFKKRQRAEILFHMQEYDGALSILNSFQYNDVKVSTVNRAIIQILSAAVLFQKGEYKTAAQIFGEKFALSGDKAGWELSVRMLRIMALTELDKKDEAENALQNLVRYSQRTVHSFEITLRNRMLIKLFVQLGKAGFSFDELGSAAYKILGELAENPELAWRFGTAELIEVDVWVRSKLRKKRGPKPGQKKKSNA